MPLPQRLAAIRRGNCHAIEPARAEGLEERRLLSVSLVSVNAAGTGTGNAASSFMGTSADGRYVLFTSLATDLVTGVTDIPGTQDLFVRDRQAGTTQLVTVNRAGTAAVGFPAGTYPKITPDGRYVAF